MPPLRLELLPALLLLPFLLPLLLLLDVDLRADDERPLLLRLELPRALVVDLRAVEVFLAALRRDDDLLPVDFRDDDERLLDDFFAADPGFDDARFFGGPPPLSRALFSAIATACFCAFFLLAGLALPIEPFRSYECISERMLLLIVPRLDPFFKGMMSLLNVIPTGAHRTIANSHSRDRC